MKFQVKFYDIIDHNKCPSSEKSAEKCILRKSYFHHSEPSYVENMKRKKSKEKNTEGYILCGIHAKVNKNLRGILIWSL